LRVVAFTLPFALPSLNQTLRTHWAKRGRQRDKLAWEIMAQLGGPAHFPRPMFERCRVTVTRHGTKLLDHDNLAGSCKLLVDSLCAPSKRHPMGLGIIVDDTPERCELIAKQDKRTNAPATIVLVEELPP
jgi:hypothetical protein